jgi:Ca2+-binding RTX toxin-like protein
VLSGKGGNDKLIAGDYTDNLDGGPGNDMLNGGYGNDTITGGPGQDTIQGDANSTTCGYWSYTCKIPFGNDVINARDGEVDNVDCGVGTDQAIVDTIDVVANCETVDGSAAAQNNSGGSSSKQKFSWKASGKKKGTVTVPCATACKVTVTLTAKGKKLATGRKTLLKAGNAKVTLKFAKPRRNLTATLKVTVQSADGKTSSSKTVKLKR